jgi:hypothetical protein
LVVLQGQGFLLRVCPLGTTPLATTTTPQTVVMAAAANSAGAVGTGDGGACAVDAMASMLQLCQTPHSSTTITDESGAASAPSRPARPPTRRGRGNRFDPFHYLANPRNHSLKQKAPLPSEEALMRKALNNLSNDAAAQRRIRSGACSKKDFQNLFLHGKDSAVTASSAPNRGVVAKKELNAIKASAMLGMLPWRERHRTRMQPLHHLARVRRGQGGAAVRLAAGHRRRWCGAARAVEACCMEHCALAAQGRYLVPYWERPRSAGVRWWVLR